MFSGAAFSQVPYSTLAELGGITGTVLETAFAQDQYSARLLNSRSSVVEAASSSDAVFTIGALRPRYADGASVLDVTRTRASSAIFISELARTADATASKLSGRIARAETATSLDTLQARRTLRSSRSETALVSETLQAFPKFPAAVLESAISSDAQSAVFNVRALVFATALAQSSQAVVAALTAARVETVQARVQTDGRINFIVRLQDGATIFDQVAGRGLWEPIPDTQDPNWVIISTNTIQ